jgi:hypothetical protein
MAMRRLFSIANPSMVLPVRGVRNAFRPAEGRASPSAVGTWRGNAVKTVRFKGCRVGDGGIADVPTGWSVEADGTHELWGRGSQLWRRCGELEADPLS